MNIYPKATTPATPDVLRMANKRAERWRVRYVAAQDEIARLLATTKPDDERGA